MALDKRAQGSLLIVKILNIAFLGTILIYMIALAFLTSGNSQYESFDGFIMAIITVILAVISIALIPFGNFIVRLAIRESRNPGILLVVYIFRMSLFESVAIYGLILGMMNDKWVAWAFALPFFIAASVLLILTFPTEEKWERMLQQRGASQP
ncbi:hypothetical protein ACFLU2_00900 [Chloroflexota bacterium]